MAESNALHPSGTTPLTHLLSLFIIHTRTVTASWIYTNNDTVEPKSAIILSSHSGCP